MKIHKLLFLFLVLLFSASNAQDVKFEKPDYKVIKSNIENKKSEYYYPVLLEKLQNRDTLINHDQYRHLYYGYTFHKNYKPYGTSKKQNEMSKFYRGEDISEKDLPKGIQLFEEELKENPMDMRAMNYLAYLYHLTNNEEMAKKISINFQGLLSAILTSGDGLECETSLHVIAVPHEYVVLNMFQMQVESQSLTGKCDYIKLKAEKDNPSGIYFDISSFYGKLF